MPDSFPQHIQQNPIYDHILWNVLVNDGSDLIVVCGRTGSGKSDTCLQGADSCDVGRNATAYHWFPRFEITRCHHFVKEFVEDITKMKEGTNKAFYPKATNFILDEANVENANVNWRDMKSLALTTALQTNRKFNYIIWMTTPDFKSLSIGTRRRVTCYIEMQNRKKVIGGIPHAQAKVEWVDWNYKTGDVYYKQHRYWKPVYLGQDKDDKEVVIWRKFKVKKVWFPLVRESLEVPYNEKKDLAMRQWYDKMNADLDYMKKYIGVGGKEVKKYSFVDLKKLFQNAKGEMVFDGILDAKGTVFEPDVEQKVIDLGYDMVSYKDFRNLYKWLRSQKLISSRNEVKLTSSRDAVY